MTAKQAQKATAKAQKAEDKRRKAASKKEAAERKANIKKILKENGKEILEATLRRIAEATSQRQREISVDFGWFRDHEASAISQFVSKKLQAKGFGVKHRYYTPQRYDNDGFAVADDGPTTYYLDVTW